MGPFPGTSAGLSVGVVWGRPGLCGLSTGLSGAPGRDVVALPGCLQEQNSEPEPPSLCCVCLGCLGPGRRNFFGASRVSSWWKSAW